MPAPPRLHRSLDLSFSGNGKLTWDISGKDDVAESMALQPDGKIVLAGSTVDGGRNAFLLARCNASGTPDTSFAGTGILRVRVGPSDDGAYDVALQPDGKIVAGDTASVLPRTTTLISVWFGVTRMGVWTNHSGCTES